MFDHVTIHVSDCAASERFYETIAPHAGLEVRVHSPEHVQCVGAESTFSLVAGPPTDGNNVEVVNHHR